MVRLKAEALVARLRDLGVASPQQIEQAKHELASTQERFSAILARQGILRDAVLRGANLYFRFIHQDRARECRVR